jgi:predicted RNase H-like nuclease/AcrR family transcriptional regulator
VPRTPRPGLSRDRVVAEALDLADEHGLAATSMRAVATRLGVEAMSLYHHVRGKDDLLDGMVDAVFAEVHRPAPGGDWRGELRRRSVSGRETLRRHPWAIGLMDSRRSPGPATIAHHDAVLGCLRTAGFDLPAVGSAVTLLDAHLYGFVLQELALPFETEAELADLGAEILDDRVARAYPWFTEFARDRAMQPGWSFAPEFGIGLDLVLEAVGSLLGPDHCGPNDSGPRDPVRRARSGRLPTRNTPSATRAEPVEVTVPVLGVDGCSAGWVGALLVPGAPRPRVVVAATIADLVESVRAELDVRVVGIDIPIGLPDNTIRQADALARRALPGRSSSVFTTLTRPAYLAADRAQADAVNRTLSGQGVGAQAFALRAKILEVDAWLRTRPTVEVVEVHPEVSFARMHGTPVTPGKRTEEGARRRIDVLAGAGLARPSVLSGRGYGTDDVLDACAVAWTAARRAAGLAHSLPDPPEVFSDGIPAAIVV